MIPEITYDVPIPTQRSSAHRRTPSRAYPLPFANLRIGGSFFTAHPHLRVMANRWKIAHRGWDYVSQREDGGTRVWRTA